MPQPIRRSGGWSLVADFLDQVRFNSSLENWWKGRNQSRPRIVLIPNVFWLLDQFSYQQKYQQLRRSRSEREQLFGPTTGQT
jgi:hypothetical protein